MILIIDFGSQTCHLIGRRIKDMGVKVQIIDPDDALIHINSAKPTGIILSGGPSSVYEKGAPQIDRKIFDLGLPVLGICYGQQLMAYLLDGKVKSGTVKEYGPAEITIKDSPLFHHIPTRKFQVWMSHGDEVIRLPTGFKYIAESNNIKAAAIQDIRRKLYAVQFHPEVQHTQYGADILKNFLNISGEKPHIEQISVKSLINAIKDTVGSEKVVMGLSGGTDSSVAAVLISKAIGKQLIPIYVESGFMRADFLINMKTTLPKTLGIKPVVIHAEKIFLSELKNVVDPEKKRKTIGRLYVELFEKEARRHKATFLAQGTTYADFIHSKSTKNSALIKSHHNVGGLPKKMKLKLLEPLRYFYTDQVRAIGRELKLPEDIIKQQPFPGPGFAVRIMGVITQKRLSQVQQADKIVIEEIEKAGLKKKIFQYWAILTGTRSTAIKGDGRFYGEVVAIRAFTTKDRMTADWAKIPYPVLQKISARIVNEVPEVSRVVYDITTKPPATMEWE